MILFELVLPKIGERVFESLIKSAPAPLQLGTSRQQAIISKYFDILFASIEIFSSYLQLRACHL